MALITATVIVTTIGVDAGPFTISDGLGNTYTGVSRAQLLAGYTNQFDDTTTNITVTSTGVCTNSLNIPFVVPTPTPTPTPSATPTPTLSPTPAAGTAFIAGNFTIDNSVVSIENAIVELSPFGAGAIIPPQNSAILSPSGQVTTPNTFIFTVNCVSGTEVRIVSNTLAVLGGAVISLSGVNTSQLTIEVIPGAYAGETILISGTLFVELVSP